MDTNYAKNISYIRNNPHHILKLLGLPPNDSFGILNLPSPNIFILTYIGQQLTLIKVFTTKNELQNWLVSHPNQLDNLIVCHLIEALDLILREVSKVDIFTLSGFMYRNFAIWTEKMDEMNFLEKEWMNAFL